MRALKLVTLSALIAVSFLGCKKDAKVEDPDGCGQYNADVPKIITTGTDEAGESMTLTIDTVGRDSSLTYYWQLPDGTKVKGATYTLPALKNASRGTYYGFYTAGNCESFKSAIEIKSPGLSIADVPCTTKENFFHLTGDSAYGNITLTPAQMIPGKYISTIKCVPPGLNLTIEIEVNTNRLITGEYTFLHFDPNGYPYFNADLARIKFKSNGNIQWGSKGGGKMYLAKTNNGKVEIFICGAEMTTVNGKQGTLEMRTELQ